MTQMTPYYSNDELPYRDVEVIANRLPVEFYFEPTILNSTRRLKLPEADAKQDSHPQREFTGCQVPPRNTDE